MTAYYTPKHRRGYDVIHDTGLAATRAAAQVPSHRKPKHRLALPPLVYQDWTSDAECKRPMRRCRSSVCPRHKPKGYTTVAAHKSRGW